jgi:hypothetical protein
MFEHKDNCRFSAEKQGKSTQNRASPRQAAKAALDELFRDEQRIHTRHYWWLRGIYHKRMHGLVLSAEDCRVAIRAAAYYRDASPDQPIPEYSDWINGGAP